MLKIEKIYGLGTYWWFEIFDESQNLAKIQDFLISNIQEFEQNYSRFIEASLLSQLNKTRVLDYPSQEMKDLINIALDYYDLSKGSFNPAIGSILENRGYDKDYSFKRHSESETVHNFSNLISISDDVIKLNGESNLDFGGFGKGYLIDKLAKSLVKEFKLQDFMINGGGDILVFGDQKKEILLENPFKSGYSFLSIDLQNQALGSSSNTKRKWKDQQTGQEFAHIINPKDLDQVSKVGSFVIASDALTADILATLVCIHCDDLSEIERLKQIKDFEYLIIDENEKITASKGFDKFVK
jgi:thiamine biosynthesis lipoprotein